MKHGIGILKFPNNDVYECSFCKDGFHGNGTYRYHDGECLKANGDLVRKMEKGSIKEQMGYFKLESGSMINFKFDTFYHF